MITDKSEKAVVEEPEFLIWNATKIEILLQAKKLFFPKGQRWESGESAVKI